jgi:dipeptidase E
MKLLLTSSGVTNASIRDALVRLLGKPVEESAALVVPTAIHPFASGPEMAARLVRGEVATPMTDLGWASVGLLELTALPSIDRDVWLPGIEAADALLVWGGDPVYLSHWLRESGLADVLPSLDRLVYVGTSAGAIATAATFGETYLGPLRHTAPALTSEEVTFGDMRLTFVTAAGAGFVDFALIPHLDHPEHSEASMANARTWAAKVPVPTYAIDDATAITVVDGVVEVVSEGTWRLFEPA